MNSEESDAEIIALSIESLKELEIKDFVVSLGYVELFPILASEIGLNPQETKLFLSLLEKRNIPSITKFLEQKNIPQENRKFLIELPLLIGNVEVLEKLEIFDSQKLREIINYLKNLHKILEDLEVSQYVVFDIGMVRTLDYYSGMIFRIFSKDIGYALCSGGRYDNLFSYYDKKIPAVGFAFSAERLMLSLQKYFPNLPKKKKILVMYCENSRKQAYKVARSLREKGEIVEIYKKTFLSLLNRNDYDEIIDLEG